jgi:hypothetical protein
MFLKERLTRLDLPENCIVDYVPGEVCDAGILIFFTLPLFFNWPLKLLSKPF